MVEPQALARKCIDPVSLFQIQQDAVFCSDAKLHEAFASGQNLQADHSRIELDRALKVGHDQSNLSQSGCC